MSDLLLAATGPGYVPHGPDPFVVYSYLMVGGWIVTHAILPLIGGVLYATYWRALLVWVAALAAASFAMQAGQELWRVSSYDDPRTKEGTLLEVAAFVLVSAFGATAIGIFIRKLWDRFLGEKVVAGVQT